MNKKYFKINDTTGLAVILKAGSSTFGKAVVDAYHPDVSGMPISFPDDSLGENRLGWQGVCPRVENPQNSYAAIREPIDRFRSALAQINLTDVDAVLDGLEAGERVNAHLHFQQDKIQDGTKLYKFPSDLEQLASDLGLEYPLPQINEGAVTNPPKPELTSEQEARVVAHYADDIALFDSITEAGQEYIAPPAPATDEAKQAKLKELKATRDSTYQGDLITSDGLPFRAHLEAIIDIQMLIQLLSQQATAEVPNPVYVGYSGSDGIARDITLSQFATALQEGAVRKMTAFATWNAKRALVDAATTAEEIDAI